MDDKLDLILKELIEVRKDVRDLMAFKNKVIGAGVVLSAIFALIFDTVKAWFMGGN